MTKIPYMNFSYFNLSYLLDIYFSLLYTYNCSIYYIIIEIDKTEIVIHP